MAVTFNIELNNKASKKGTFVVFLRITQNKKHSRKKTTVEITKKSDFNPKAKFGKWIRSSEPKHEKYNQVLANEIENAKEIYLKIKKTGSATKEIIKENISIDKKSPSFLTYARERTQAIYQEGGFRNYKKYNGFCNKLTDFLANNKKKDLLFSELSSSILSKFEAYLHSLSNARNHETKLHPNTISLTLRIFKTLVNRAVEVDKYITTDQNPFLGYKYNQPRYAAKEKLSLSEILDIENLELDKDTLIWNVRNYFLFSFYMAGIRAGDLIQLRWANITSDGRLEYRMGKTLKDRNMKIHKKPMDILSHYRKETNKPMDYIFPILKNSAPYAQAITEDQKATLTPAMVQKLSQDVSAKNALINKYLKLIAERAGITKRLTLNIARHSFAKIAKEKSVDNLHLKNILGHSDISITERYMGSFETAETDAVMNSIFQDKNDVIEKMKKQLSQLDADERDRLFKEFGYEHSRPQKSNKKHRYD